MYIYAIGKQDGDGWGPDIRDSINICKGGAAGEFARAALLL